MAALYHHIRHCYRPLFWASQGRDGEPHCRDEACQPTPNRHVRRGRTSIVTFAALASRALPHRLTHVAAEVVARCLPSRRGWLDLGNRAWCGWDASLVYRDLGVCAGGPQSRLVDARHLGPDTLDSDQVGGNKSNRVMRPLFRAGLPLGSRRGGRDDMWAGDRPKGPNEQGTNW